MDDHASKKTVFPDTNVLIHGRSAKDLPWVELGADEVDIVLCGPVIREIDALKNKGGKVGRTAKEVSSTVRSLMTSPGMIETLRARNPLVTRRLSPGSANNAPVRAGLDLGHGDQAIINQALAARDAGLDAMLLTDDNIAAMTAAEHGLPVMVMPDSWMKQPEGDEPTKELARRDAEIERLRAAEPKPRLRFLDMAGRPIERLEGTLRRYGAIGGEDLDALMRRVDAIAPKFSVSPTRTPQTPKPPPGADPAAVNSFAGALAALAFPMKPVTAEDVGKYSSDHDQWFAGVRRQLAKLHAEWNKRREWPRAKLAAVNAGTRPAADVLVEIEARGPFMLSGFKVENSEAATGAGEATPSWLEIPVPPVPPREQPHQFGGDVLAGFLRAGGYDTGAMVRPRTFPDFRRDADAFYHRDGRREPVGTMSLECKSWRHQRDEDDFLFRTWGSDAEDIRGLVVGRVSASNLSDPIETTLPVRIGFEDRSVLHIAEQMVDDLERRMADPRRRTHKRKQT